MSEKPEPFPLILMLSHDPELLQRSPVNPPAAQQALEEIYALTLGMALFGKYSRF